MGLIRLEYSVLEDVAADLDLVMQSSNEGDWEWASDDKKAETWRRFLTEPTAEDAVGLSGRLCLGSGIWMTFALASTDGPNAHAVVDVSAPETDPAVVEGLKDNLVARTREWSQEGVESLFLFDLLTTSQAYLADHPPKDRKAERDDSDAVESAKDASAHVQPLSSSVEIQLSRALFWSHHLKAPSKLKDFNNWCPELQIWGVLRVGWPGYLCFEGPSSSVDEMIRRVKSLQWHAIQLRSHHSWTFKPESDSNCDPVSQALLSCRLASNHPDNTCTSLNGQLTDASTRATKVRTGCQVLESMGEIVARLRESGLEETEISEALGLRVSNNSKDK
ncbi:hypothetical protein BCV70DRAFT_196851 [Testicularia cyperi]|uniref:Uncharacterized protein n=1 Tax=Testicularia cyperi TaxID=1882483 RepID=A0A317XZ35_9BASI|nr:hypothetical protein BCV70DRAFT_196851 [Testicularia cyperi]